MPIPATSPKLIPLNAVYVPVIEISSRIVGGKLQTGARLLLAGADCAQAGTPHETWTPAGGPPESVHLPDLAALPADLADLAPQIAAVFGQVVALVGEVNARRQLI